jgi:hypothetical protein
MLSPLRSRFGIPGVISVIALVFAMFGGAYAATDHGGKATASAKAKRGPRGPKGATGPAGPAGPAGAAGAKGDKGDSGAAGNNGIGATTESFSGEVHGCKAGGVIVKSASPEAIVCNGKNGTNGTNGTTGFTKTLPGGETETGSWAFGFFLAAPSGGGSLRVPISFAIPLAAPLTGTGCTANPPAATCHVHYINKLGKEVITFEPLEAVTSTTCLGSAAAPTAVAGNLCVYTSSLVDAKSGNGSISKIGEAGEGVGAATAGALLNFPEPEEETQGWGTWAVTAEEE